jgi:hypothetical protein
LQISKKEELAVRGFLFAFLHWALKSGFWVVSLLELAIGYVIQNS